MNRFILIRHAKSSWKFPDSTDHQRPLNKRGRKDGPKIASHIAHKGPFVPNYFLLVQQSAHKRLGVTFKKN